MTNERGVNSDEDRRFMELAIEEMANSVQEKNPMVGAVLVANGRVVGKGHREAHTHAERAAISQAQATHADLKGSILYTTLEPCASDDNKRESCSELISRVGISTVVIGRYDVNPTVSRKGWRKLLDAAVKCRDFPADLRARIDSINRQFTEHFAIGYGDDHGAKFDYMRDGGRFEFRFSREDPCSIVSQWNMLGPGQIQTAAIAPARVALAEYAKEFADIDDPTALDFGTYRVHVQVNQIAVFLHQDWSLLVKVENVENGAYGKQHWGEADAATSVKLVWERRSVAS